MHQLWAAIKKAPYFSDCHKQVILQGNVSFLHEKNRRTKKHIFSHPDYTVGFVISTNPAAKSGSRAITAGREFHPAPKTLFSYAYIIPLLHIVYKRKGDDNPPLFSVMFTNGIKNRQPHIWLPVYQEVIHETS